MRVEAFVPNAFVSSRTVKGQCAKPENSKSEYRNSKQVRMTEIQDQTSIALHDAAFFRFGFRRRLVSDFGIRASDFRS
ncbi:MAG: hypothetical protein DMF02_05750 [Verrucomicrobia bacterium]|nr:MAG: hypothetical protein DMF02_05750 [Verrucomicrobiota bacterium]